MRFLSYRFFAFHELKIATSHFMRNFELSMKDNKVTMTRRLKLSDLFTDILKQPKFEYTGPTVTTENVPIVLKLRAKPLEEFVSIRGE